MLQIIQGLKEEISTSKDYAEAFQAIKSSSYSFNTYGEAVSEYEESFRGAREAQEREAFVALGKNAYLGNIREALKIDLSHRQETETEPSLKKRIDRNNFLTLINDPAGLYGEEARSDVVNGVIVPELLMELLKKSPVEINYFVFVDLKKILLYQSILIAI